MNTKENNIDFVVQVVDGLLNKILNSLQNYESTDSYHSWFSNCNTLKKMLDELGINYELIDVTEKPEYLKKYSIFTALSLIIDNKLEFIGIPQKKDLEKKLS